MTIIRHNVISGTVVAPNLPRIGYENYFRSGTVTASSEAVGKPKDLAYDGLTYDAWQTTGGESEWIRTQLAVAALADYMAVSTHTLVGCNVTPQRSTDGAAWTNLHAAYTVPDNRPIIWEFDSVSDVYWRLLIENAAAQVSLGAIHVGRRFTMLRGIPSGWAPPELNEDRKVTNVMSEGGQILGRNIIRRGVAAEIESRDIEYSWARNEWKAFMDVAERFAVFMWWVNGIYAEVMYGGVQEDHSARFTTDLHVTTKFKLMGINR